MQEYRVRKLKLILNGLRNDLQKREYEEKSREIQKLEHVVVDHSSWMENYRKLKLRLTTGK